MRSFVVKTRAFSIAAGSVVALLVACSQDAVGPDTGPVESVAVQPSTATVAVGANMSLSAEVRDASGALITGQRVSWSSEDASIAEVSASGMVTGRKVGSVLIAASARGKDAFALVTVNPIPVEAVRLSTANRSMMVGQTFQLNADALDAGGQVLAGRPISWTTSAPTVATVAEDGLVNAVAPGGAIITATSEGKSAFASITVAEIPVASVVVAPVVADLVVGQTTQLNAQLRDASGGELTDRAITWSSNRVDVATVTSEGLVTAVGQGSATITAASEGRSATATVTVTPRPVSAVIVSPGQVSLFAGQTLQLSTLVTDDRGQVLTGRPVHYASSNFAVATVSSLGLITAIGPGTATITVTSEGATGTATVIIAPEPVATVVVTPSPASVIVGNTVQLAASPRNAAGQPLQGRTVTWSTGAPGLASVSSLGVVTGLAPGNAVIIATVDGRQGSSLVTVRDVPVFTVSVTPTPATVTTGQTLTLTATLRDASGTVLSGRVVGWSTSAPAIATVSGTGVVTGVAAGTATITASSEGKTGSATVTVTPPGPVLTTIAVAPSAVTVNVAWTTPLTATARDQFGKVMTGVSFTWTTSSTSIATVNSSGVVTGVAPGSATITARSGTVTGTASVTVQLAPVDRIVVTPSNPSVDEGKSVQLTATLYDAQNNVLTGRTVTWSTSNASRVTVTSTGLATGVNDGTTATITASSGGKSGSTTVRVRD